MFTGAEHKFKGYKHIFKGGEHKFTEHEQDQAVGDRFGGM